MKKIKTKFLALFAIILSIITFGSKTKPKSNESIDSLIARADISDEQPDNYDEEYVHDEAFIQLKASELKTEISNSYEQIDNIILYESLITAFNEWKGTKYKWGGDAKSGIDCSALTRRVYRAVFNGYELPRVSIDQVKKGRVVSKESLKPGDILFFRPRNRVNHTAVYLGNSLFINASSSKGVVLSSLENSYWKKYFKYGVRVDEARNN